MSQETAISVQHVNKNFKLPHEKHSGLKQLLLNFRPGGTSYELQHVLRDINFEIKKGEFFAIVGRNGSGKSTLLKILAGIYQPSSGQVVINGKLVPFIELGVGFNPELTGRENVYLNGALLGFSVKETDAMYRDIVEFAELEAFMDQKLKNYSSGMQVRLAFSIAIRAKSDILLIDEVLAVGDANFQQKCFDYFEKLKRTKQTVVFVSHDMGAVRRFCTRAVYISNGDIIKVGTPSDIADLYAESNIATDPRDEAVADSKLSEQHKIKSRITERSSHSVTIQIDYRAQNDEPMYIGLSILKDGAVLGEVTTSPSHPLVGAGTVSYTLKTDHFNAGSYQVGGVCLFRQQNRELLAVSKSNGQFVIKGNDVMRGGALKLEDTWGYGTD
jgi:ABC-type polysaccharide/polyol phosphate transport system ATPase subunit